MSHHSFAKLSASLTTMVVLTAAIVAVTESIHSQPRRATHRRTVKIHGREAIANEVLVEFARPLDQVERAALDDSVDADENEHVAADVRRIHSRRFDAETLTAFLGTHQSVAAAEPNWIVHADRVPNEPQFPRLWAFSNTGQNVNSGGYGTTGADIDALRAWDLTTGSRANVVAVLDTGIDYTHPDLAANVWSAPAPFRVTIGGVAIICAAGTHGFNVIRKTCDPRDDNDHGTHIAGTIGAVGNNGAGVAGVNWRASLMAIKFLDETGTGTIADAISGMEFVIQAKNAFAATRGANVRVLSNSWNGGAFSKALQNEITKTSWNNMLFVASAGNDSMNIDANPSYPASYPAANVVAVAATDNSDQLAPFSNFGASAHLGAPGVNILSTERGAAYGYLSGTSMAASEVSGAAALVLSKCALNWSALKSNLLANVDVVGALTGWVKSNGRLNVDHALRACTGSASIPTNTTAVPAPPQNVKATSGPNVGDIRVAWSASSGATSYKVKRSMLLGGPYSTIQTVTNTSYVNSRLTSGKTYYYLVTALNQAGQSAESAKTYAAAK